MSDTRGRFLEVEDQANRMLEQIQKLKASMDAHEDAATSLGAASDSVRTLASEAAESARALSALITRLGEIGAPEMLESIRKGQAQTSRVLRLVWVITGLAAATLCGVLAATGLLLTKSG